MLLGYQDEKDETAEFHPTDGSFHPSFILKLQTARFRTPGELQTRDLVQNHRLDVLYLPIGVLDLENE